MIRQFMRWVFLLIFITLSFGCATSDDGESEGVDFTGSQDDSGDDDTVDLDVDDDIYFDDDSIIDDTALNDDTNALDDDSAFDFPPNIDLYGVVSWDVELGPHFPGLFFSAVQRYYKDYYGNFAQCIECQLSDIWGSSPDDIYVVGYGIIMDWHYETTYSRYLSHYNGFHWTTTLYPSQPYPEQSWTMYRIFGASPSDIYIIGDINGGQYVIYHYDGSNLDVEIIGSQYSGLSALWVSPNGDVFAVGANDQGHLFVVKKNGVWSEEVIPTNDSGLHTVWGASDGIVLTTDGIIMYRYINNGWEQMNEPGLENIVITKISGISSTDVYAIGYMIDDNDKKVLMNYNGTLWEENIIPSIFSDTNPVGLWVAAHDSVFVSLGNYFSGILIYYDGISWRKISYNKGEQALWGFVIQ